MYIYQYFVKIFLRKWCPLGVPPAAGWTVDLPRVVCKSFGDGRRFFLINLKVLDPWHLPALPDRSLLGAWFRLSLGFSFS